MSVVMCKAKGIELRTWIIGAADGDRLGELVLDFDRHVRGTSAAEGLSDGTIGHFEFSVRIAVEAANRLASLTLLLGEG